LGEPLAVPPPPPPAPIAGGASTIQLGIYPPVEKALEIQELALSGEMPNVIDLRPQLVGATELRLKQREDAIRRAISDLKWTCEEFEAQMSQKHKMMKGELALMNLKQQELKDQSEMLDKQLAEIQSSRQELELKKREIALQEVQILTLQKKAKLVEGIEKVKVQRQLVAVSALYRRSIVGFARDQVLISIKNSDLSRVAVLSKVPSPVLYMQYKNLLDDELGIKIMPHGFSMTPCSRCGRLHRTYDIEGDAHKQMCPRCVYITNKKSGKRSKLT
jgi:hypothetical protein